MSYVCPLRSQFSNRLPTDLDCRFSWEAYFFSFFAQAIRRLTQTIYRSLGHGDEHFFVLSGCVRFGLLAAVCKHQTNLDILSDRRFCSMLSYTGANNFFLTGILKSWLALASIVRTTAGFAPLP